MVVVDTSTMFGSDQYLQPDYMSSLPTTLDAKKSPLALLAQTCSQIGADVTSGSSTQTTSSSSMGFAGGPIRSGSTSSSTGRKSRSPLNLHQPSSATKSSKSHHRSSPRVSSANGIHAASTSPIIRSGLDMSNNNSNSPPNQTVGGAFYHPSAISKDSPYQSPYASMFAPPFPYPFAPPPLLNPYLSYARLMQQHLMEAGGGLPYSASDLSPPALAPAHAQSHVSSSGSSASTTNSHSKSSSAKERKHSSSSSGASGNTQQPYVCNWSVGGDYCGKKFASSDDLLSHLRSHTSTLGNPSSSEALSHYLSHPAFGFFPPIPPSPAASGDGGPVRYPGFPPMPDFRYHPYGAPPSSNASAKQTGSSSNPSLAMPTTSPPLPYPYYAYPALYATRLIGPAIHP